MLANLCQKLVLKNRKLFFSKSSFSGQFLPQLLKVLSTVFLGALFVQFLFSCVSNTTNSNPEISKYGLSKKSNTKGVENSGKDTSSLMVLKSLSQQGFILLELSTGWQAASNVFGFLKESDFRKARESANFTSLRIGLANERTLSQWELSILAAQGFSSLAFAKMHQISMLEKNENQALEESLLMSKHVLKMQGLSLQVYRWALSAFSVAHVLKQTEKVSSTLSFQDWQNTLCIQVCDSAGWKALAEFEGGTLTLEGFGNRILAQSQFQLAGQKRPKWISDILYPQKLVDSETAKLQSPTSVAGESLHPCQSQDFFALLLKTRTQRHLFSRQDYYKMLLQVEETFQKHSCSELKSENKLEKNQKILKFGNKDGAELRIENMLWLARISWEFGNLSEAKVRALSAETMALEDNKWDLFLEFLAVYLGRILYEESEPKLLRDEILKVGRAFREKSSLYSLSDSDSHPVFIEIEDFLLDKLAFASYLSGMFEEAFKLFNQLASKKESSFLTAKYLYWSGRALQAANSESASAFYLKAGNADPLSIYDIFSGQMLQNRSNRASSQLVSPFEESWEIEYKSLAEEERSDLLFDQKENNPGLAQIALSLQTATLNFRFVKLFYAAVDENSSQESYVGRILRSELTWLRQNYFAFIQNSQVAASTNKFEITEQVTRVAWLTSLSGDYSSSISFLSAVRDFLKDKNFSSMNRLFFIFYPRPYLSSFVQASQTCGVDLDLLYAISRQESLFQPAIKSPVGAIGLLQLMPSTAKKYIPLATLENSSSNIIEELKNPDTNTVAGACYLKSLLTRYNNNLTFAIAAYNAGENKVDTWISRRLKFADMPLFVESIPIQETKDYVQKVLRNYYNIKWIYAVQP